MLAVGDPPAEMVLGPFVRHSEKFIGGEKTYSQPVAEWRPFAFSSWGKDSPLNSTNQETDAIFFFLRRELGI